MICRLIAVAMLAALPVPVQAEEPAARRDATVARAVAYLRAAQSEDGSYSSFAGPAITALVATGLMDNGLTPVDPTVARTLTYLEGFVQEDGGVYGPDSMYRNYETCVAVQCLDRAAKSPNAPRDYADTLAGAEVFLKGLQWDEAEGHDPTSTSYGGAGYGKHRRPDLSNTAFLVEALHALGRGPEDPAIQRALLFVSRTQNLESEHNTTPFSVKVGDGGFYYTPAAGGSSQAGETETGGLRSYGSMTYAGLKSMIYAGVGPDDPRVQAARTWIARHYTLEENPQMGSAGYYYYLHTFAKALAAVGDETFADAEGVQHRWRAELIAKLAELQTPAGSWINPNERWLEADPNLSTAYALLALAQCQ
ncbi:prenyltransferase/squalene oxidase repeat-containing protein [Botrimarina hoheduenensis]|uniref:Squalene cyclase C-terminal domain-containing protein n=1 Tax=Botrimarina hoheduenensis TaxID=2528000 RepID=A0A5C5WAS9_9BACT|nr:prenyltransferase/squalene oxidase repeat-containing protein [Botrimarina hoheduenensis]TWT46712.1 hypothetical protein Pla111_18130 [Botrimarina hoheduenensis]